MSQTSNGVVIDARPEQIWPYLTTDKLLKWQHGSGPYSSIKQANINLFDDPNGDKTGAIAVTTSDNRQVTMRLAEFNEPRYITFHCAYLVAPVTVDQFLSFELEPVEGETGIQTLLTITTDWQIGEVTLPLKMLASFGVAGKFNEMIEFTLRNIKKLVESEIVATNEEVAL